MTKPAKRSATHRSSARFHARVLQGAKPAPFPGFIKPQLATLRETVPSGADWLHEIKFDGYRVQGHLIEGKPALITRNGHDWTGRMKSLASALERLPANNLVVDGEVIVPDGKGASDFDALEIAMGPRGRSADMLFYLFDLLHLDGFDLRAAPLLDSKRVLKELLSGINELVTNSIKYGFVDDRVGQILIKLQANDDLVLTVTDNGIGLPSPEQTTKGVGSKVVALLAQQLNGTISYEPANPGCRVILRMPKPTI